MRRTLILGPVLAAALLSGGCLVQGQCQTHADCLGDESCDQQTHECRVECETDMDCWAERTPGMVCVDHRCDFSRNAGARVNAPDFCLDVVNPKSSYYGKELCLKDLRGKVVMVFFALLV
jgi:hypothetical protein